ncbi:hypothetical protein PVK62_08075 [Aliivibrio sp. S3MY1]|uniref:Lipoprotein SmpA/OmlA domain-containing protein n=1 Tax=Aliivibrio wodanis TaxID=80852 RepID=A0A5Q4ZYS9_9GAMM|nr:MULTISPECIES: hypothetical protein [Aliivibrio]MDD9175993.1 hypothetical protein [Aliivibrio sp. S3TY1]MDD9193092.1 hypothetical protein [Aliivibrio sp. S2TY2]MDD9195796.1 hypothetical protein [Aliivibrio sp. S3MY1]VVV07017.1 hypothetical protein AW0309160_04511 [Aliivibrio wodanis]
MLRRTIAIFALITALAGCASSEMGRPINYAKLERLTLGVSTQETVKEFFGYPQQIMYPDNRTIYKYRYLKTSTSSHTRHAVDFVFNHNQRLIDITINDAIDLESIKME